MLNSLDRLVCLHLSRFLLLVHCLGYGIQTTPGNYNTYIVAVSIRAQLEGYLEMRSMKQVFN